jgi:hypothetical protein
VKTRGVAQLLVILGVALFAIIAYVEGPRIVANAKQKTAVKAESAAVQDTTHAVVAVQAAAVAEKKADAEAGSTILRDAIEGSTASGKLPPGAPADFVAARFDSITNTAISMFGAPTASNSAQWRALALAALSENADERLKAQAQVAAQNAENAVVVGKLKDAQNALEAANSLTKQAVENLQAKDKELQVAQKNLDAQTGFLAKLKRWAIYAGVAWLLFQLLTVLAKTNPALAGVVAGINAVVSPALSLAHNELGKAWTAAKAETVDLSGRVGAFVAQVRHETPIVAASLTTKLDALTDKVQQSAIGQAAEAELAALRAAAAAEALKAKEWLASQVAPVPPPPPPTP